MEKNNHLSQPLCSNSLPHAPAPQTTPVAMSFAALESNAEPLIDLFFARLFQIAPKLRCMFPNDLHRTKIAFLRTITRLVHADEHSNEWCAELERLGERHKQYGVTDTEYEIFGQALFWTLEKGLGQDWTEPLQHAWHNWYAHLTHRMLAQSVTLSPDRETLQPLSIP